jgi:hypothetical protein
MITGVNDKLAPVRILLMALIGLTVCAQGAPQKQKKPTDIEILETRARRTEDKILVDGNVRVSGEKPLRGLVVVFDLISAEKTVVATEKAVLGEDAVDPGQERSYRAATADTFRAVTYRIRAFDTAGRELRVGNGGPFSIE